MYVGESECVGGCVIMLKRHPGNNYCSGNNQSGGSEHSARYLCVTAGVIPAQDGK